MTEPERLKLREKFAEEFRHYFGGLVLDAATAGRTGAELAISIRFTMRNIDRKLGEAFDMLMPGPPPAATGQPPTKGKP